MKSNAKFIVIGFLLLNSIVELQASTNSAVVLMYHRFAENRYPATNIREEQFIEQLDFLQKNHYQVWPLPKIIEHLNKRQQLPDKVVAITVDDAYASVFNIAFPLLKKRNIPFTVFVATDPVDKQLSNYMSWAQVREMAESGVTIGNHSMSHGHLVERLSGESDEDWLVRVMADIKWAENRIKEKTGVETTLFAYPYGEFNLRLSQALKKNSYVAFGQHSGPFDARSDVGFLPRYPVSEDYSDSNDFAIKLASMPMPIESVFPLEVVTESATPVLQVQLSIKPDNKADLHCYISGQRKSTVEWQSDTRFSVAVTEPINIRRARYNCTLYDKNTGRYFWYSHLWIRPEFAEAP